MKNEFCNINITPGLIVGIGELLWDKLPDGKKLGGAPANFAYHVSQFGLPSCAVSAIGDDADGYEMLETIRKKNIPVTISLVDNATGTVDVTMNSNGIPEYEIHENVAWDNIPSTNSLAEIARNTAAVCFGTLAQRNEVSRSTIIQFINAMPEGNNILKIYDINLRQNFYSKEIIEHSLSLCNILKINDDEIKIVTDELKLTGINMIENCQELIRRYKLQILILTCGENGSYIFTPSEQSYLPTPKVDVADTVGAGDSFTAAFTVAILQGASIKEAHKKAVDISAFVCTRHGAMPAIPESIKL